MNYHSANFGKPSNESTRGSQKNANLRPPRSNTSIGSNSLTASIEKKHDDFRRQNEEIKNIDSSEDVVFVDELEDTKDDLIRSQGDTIHELQKKLNELQKSRLSVLNANNKKIVELENELKQCQHECNEYKKQLEDRHELEYGIRRENGGTKSGAASRLRATQSISPSSSPSLAIQEAQPKETLQPLPARPLRNIDNKINSKFWECLSKTHSQWSMNEIPSLQQQLIPTVLITGPNGSSYSSFNDLIEAAATALTYSIVRNECKKMSAVIEKAAAKNSSNSKLVNIERKSHIGVGVGGTSSASSSRSSTGTLTVDDDDDEDNDEDYQNSERHVAASVSVKARGSSNNNHSNSNTGSTTKNNQSKPVRTKPVVHSNTTTTATAKANLAARPPPLGLASESEEDLEEEEEEEEEDPGLSADEKRVLRMCNNLKAWIRCKKKFKIEELTSAHSHLEQDLVRRAFSKLEREDFVYVDLSGTRNPHYKISEAELHPVPPPSTPKSKKRSNQTDDSHRKDNSKKRETY